MTRTGLSVRIWNRYRLRNSRTGPAPATVAALNFNWSPAAALSPVRWWCNLCSSTGENKFFCNVIRQCCYLRVWVGRSCRLRPCVIDRACIIIPEGMVIGENAEEDARRFLHRSEEGIVLVTREMLLRKLQVKQGDNAGFMYVQRCSPLLAKTGGWRD